MSEIKIGVIGGSGLYEMEGLVNVREQVLSTPFGNPSDAYHVGELNSVEIVFLPRHGRGHVFSPSRINYRANIWGMKKLGITHIISVSACGSLLEEIVPGHLVIIDQFIDRTLGKRNSTFFDEGIVGHISFADPICPNLARLLYETGKDLGMEIHNGGTYLCMEGPAFSTRAESNLYRSWNATVIGMTNLTEARLAREAQICYATIALATDYDSWRHGDADVEIQDIIEIMGKNIKNAKAIIARAAGKVEAYTTCKCPTATQNAVLTSKDAIPLKTRETLEIIIGKYLD